MTRKTERVPAAAGKVTRDPFPGSRKIHAAGALQAVRVPMREVAVTPTRRGPGQAETANPPVVLYDTSGPYTDPSVDIDLRRGLAPTRDAWIRGRGDVEELRGAQ